MASRIENPPIQYLDLKPCMNSASRVLIYSGRSDSAEEAAAGCKRVEAAADAVAVQLDRRFSCDGAEE